MVGQLLTIQATHYSLGLPLPLQAMLSIVAGMVVFNIASLLGARAGACTMWSCSSAC